VGLCFNTGPSWEKDSLNQIQFDSMAENAKDMLNERRPGSLKHEPESFPNITSANTGPRTE